MARDMKRVLAIIELFTNGKTLQEIGDSYGITRERVRQILKRYGYKGVHGGAAVSDRHCNALGMTRLEKEAAERQFPGCIKAYRQQKSTAARRGIEWEITFREWLAVWDGHWNRRGRGDGLVMCRKKDQGPYKVGNVYLATNSFNATAYQMRKWHGVDIESDPYYTGMIV